MNRFINFLITVYIITILAWSGFVRAESVQLDNAYFNDDNFMLVIEGRTNSACGVSIQSELSGSQPLGMKPTVLVKVVKNNNNDICFTLESKRYFSKVVDIRSLGLSNGSYNLALTNKIANKDKNFHFSVNIPLNSYYPNFNPIELSGVLSKSEAGDWILISDQGQVITLKSDLDLSRYTDHRVFIEGTEILHRVGPGIEIAERSPLRAKQSSEDPTVFLFTISTEMY